MPTAPRRTPKPPPAVPTEPPGPIRATAIVKMFEEMAEFRLSSAARSCERFALGLKPDGNFLDAVRWLASDVIECQVAAEVYSTIAKRLAAPYDLGCVDRLKEEESRLVDMSLYVGSQPSSSARGIAGAAEDCHRIARSRVYSEAVKVIRKYLAGQIDDDLVREGAPDV